MWLHAECKPGIPDSMFLAWGSGRMCHGCLSAWVYFPQNKGVKKWVRQKDRWVHTQGSLWHTKDMCLDSGLPWRHSWVLELRHTPWDSLILLAAVRNRKVQSVLAGRVQYSAICSTNILIYTGRVGSLSCWVNVEGYSPVTVEWSYEKEPS